MIIRFWVLTLHTGHPTGLLGWSLSLHPTFTVILSVGLTWKGEHMAALSHRQLTSSVNRKPDCLSGSESSSALVPGSSEMGKHRGWRRDALMPGGSNRGAPPNPGNRNHSMTPHSEPPGDPTANRQVTPYDTT